MDELRGFWVGGIWKTASVDAEPEIFLIRWRIFEIMTKAEARERHLVGYSFAGREGRASTAIETFDPSTGRVRTRSGRVYQLIGKPHIDLDGQWVWRKWSRVQGFSEELDVTAEYVELLLQAGSAHLRRG